MKKFILTTRSESCDDYMYFIEHPEKPTNEEINKFLMKYGSDRDEEMSYENINMLEELESFQRLKPNKKLGSLSQHQTDLVYDLRNESGLGMMDCKKMLINSDWDFEAAKLASQKFISSGRILVHCAPVEFTDEELLDLYNKGFNDELLGYRSLEPSEFKSALEKAAYFHGKAIAFFGDDQPSLDYKSNEEILKTIKSKIL
jgi:hypothetical protein